MNAISTIDARPRFGGLFWKLARRTTAITLPLAGHRWNPVFAVVVHRGRRTGLERATPVAVRRVTGGFVIALAFGVQVDWYRNLVVADGGTIRWRGSAYPIGSPRPIDGASAGAAFHPIQRLLLRMAGIDGYVRVDATGPR